MNKKAKRMKEKETKNIIIIIIQVILIFAMIISGVKIYFWWQDNKQNEIITSELIQSVTVEENEKGESKYKINFEELKKKNSDTVAWLKVNNTQIEYPIVKAKDNYFYLNHSFDKSVNGAGWLFASYDNKIDGTDKNIVIFGHNRTGGPMFGTLKKILNKQWYNNEENKHIIFNTEKEDCIYEIFSIYTIQAEDYYITTQFDSDKQYETFLNIIKKRSINDFENSITTKDKILTLSTCADNDNYRVVLHAKKVVQ